MKNIEDMLNNIQVPKLENGEFFGKLRVELMQTFLNPQRVYQVRYKWAVSFAALFFVLLIIAFSSPGIVSKVNNFAFGSDNETNQELIAEKETDSSNPSYAEACTSIVDKPSNSITSDKTYMINQYKSPSKGRIMIVSEYGDKPQNNKIRKVSASCY